MLSCSVTRTTAWLAGPWNLKFLYLWYFIATGIYAPYLGLYLRAIRLDGAQIGLVASMAPLVGVLLQPLWGLLSDR